MALSMRQCFSAVAVNLCLRQSLHRPFILASCRYSTDDTESPAPQQAHAEAPKYKDEYSLTPPKGKIFDKKPFRMMLEAGRKYAWCSCGHSRTQPLCDGTHKTLEGTQEKKIMQYKFRPHRFSVEETKEYWLCNCKQSDKRPFCDGTHKQDHIQAAVR